MTPFTKIVYAAVKQIPKGETRSYKQVAVAIGHPRAYRAVANALANNTDKSVPCHRVIKSDGSVGGYNGLRGEKKFLLTRERALVS